MYHNIKECPIGVAAEIGVLKIQQKQISFMNTSSYLTLELARIFFGD